MGLGDEAIRQRIAGRLFGEATAVVRIGRFRILDIIGAGGMGVVYAAHDDELDRRVAVKLIHRLALGEDDAERRRLRREARALARLSHPNVVHVYDAGFHEDALYIVMELVDGVTLRRWLQTEARPWEDILARFVEAGRGLVAAHEAGIVHRDFKPANALLGADGRVRVVDFGLARGTDAETEPDQRGRAARARGASASASELTTRITGTGRLTGTPAYMSPEQHRGGEVDPRSDQFSFCVALYEALYGERPFSVDQVRSCSRERARVGSERRRRPSGAPPWVHSILLRGLQLERASRYPTMHELLDALTRTPALRRRRVSFAAAGLAVAALVAMTASLSKRERACAPPESILEGVWDEPTRAEVRAAFERSGLRYAERSWGTLRAALDDYADRWSSSWRDACEDRRSRADADARRYERSVACLRRRVRSLDMLTQTLRDADAGVVERAAALPSSLPPLAACSDVSYLGGRARPLTPEGERRVDEAHSLIDQAEQHRVSARPRDASPLIERAEEIARALEHDALSAEVGLVAGNVRATLGSLAEAAVTLERAYKTADLAGLDRERGEIASALARVMVDRNKFDDASWWVNQASSAVERAGATPVDRGRVAGISGLIATRTGELARAEELLHEQVAVFEREFGEDHLETVTAYLQLANLFADQGRSDDAIALYEIVRRRRARLLGAQHPSVASALFNLALLLQETGALAEARAKLERVLEIRRESLGPEHLTVGSTLFLVAQLDASEARLDAAARTAEQARVIFDLQPDRALDNRVYNLVLLGEIYGELDRPRDQIEVYAALIELSDELDETLRFAVEFNLGDALCRAGRCHEAEAHLARARAYADAKLDAGGPERGLLLLRLGESALARDRPAVAAARYREALAAFSEPSSRDARIDAEDYAEDDGAGSDATEQQRAQARLGLAQALHAAAGAREEIIALARRARVYFDGREGYEEQLERVDALLAERGAK